MKLDHIIILVRSLNASLGWYDTLPGLLGFSKSRDPVWGNEDGLHIDLQQARPDTGPY